MERFQLSSGLVGYRSPLLAEVGVPHVFTTRRGDGGLGFDARRLDDERTRVLCRLLATPARPERRITRVRQVHGAEVHDPRPGDPADADVAADALVTEDPARALLVRAADCAPVLVATTCGARVAAIHAGWRGVVAGVVPATLAAFAGRGPLVAAIGPCISVRWFEVGDEVARAFEQVGLAESVRRAPGERAHVDLAGAVRLQLLAGGVEVVDRADACTYAAGDELPSYRREVTHGGGVLSAHLAGVVAPGDSPR